MEPLWIFLNTNQLLFFIPLMSVDLPANAVVLFKVLSFAHGDLILLVLLYDHTIGKFIPESSKPPFAPNFELLGFETTSLLDNVGIFYSMLGLQLLFIVLFLFFSKLLNSTLARCCYKSLDKMLWSPLIRTFF